ncbi:MAG: hypothetical protein ABL931_17185 [Usitatibacteraceae bacterium]
MEIKPIRMTVNAGLDSTDDPLVALQARFGVVAAALQTAYRERSADAFRHDGVVLSEVVSDFLAVMLRLDREYGADSALPIEDAPDAVDEALRALAELESWLIRLSLEAQLANLQAVEIGIGYWAMRHALPILTVEPIVNALAAHSNAATSTQETAAVYALMQGFISHFSPTLKPDLERSNPQRPWRLLNLNFAITAIRTGDDGMMRYAFDTLNAHLPDERSGFYEEAHALASRPGFPSATKTLIEGELARWTRVH